MYKHKLTSSPRCPVCYSGDVSITAYGCVCNNCGEIFIPDGWLEDAAKLISKASKAFIKRSSKPQGDLTKRIAVLGSFIRRSGPMILKKAPAVFKLFI